MDTLFEWAKSFWGLWLMAIFIGICVYALWPSRKRQREMEEHARIPLEDPADALERPTEEKKDGRQD